MSEAKKTCDLCGLTVEVPNFTLKTKEGEKSFCCEGCLGIYQMLHEIEETSESDNKQS
ncbi:MAG: heavy metal translocating P-type ATPase metal-binding domain-containing protein [Methylococcaceae bacterium]|nr:heavy metal translocating P-type ATPase metal-binding domain-containing protein [Methylococcaceae bacterium]MDD1609135.1 heavy metal translocating P-type ATPase metal-binding domain-containing protein [Methylococcaceae bacterium]MDD1614952.1 heavy metal translocating P-type ATPase metal-binding domain-containing protein [Methylococcaceae bacterium]